MTKSAKKTQRAKNLSSEDVRKIVELINAWTERLTWDRLIDKLFRSLYQKYTRQALAKHDVISRAFAAKQKALRVPGPAGKVFADPVKKVEAEKLERLKNEIKSLEQIIASYEEKFVIWATNAKLHGMTDKELNKPLIKK